MKYLKYICISCLFACSALCGPSLNSEDLIKIVKKSVIGNSSGRFFGCVTLMKVKGDKPKITGLVIISADDSIKVNQAIGGGDVVLSLSFKVIDNVFRLKITSSPPMGAVYQVPYQNQEISIAKSSILSDNVLAVSSDYDAGGIEYISAFLWLFSDTGGSSG